MVYYYHILNSIMTNIFNFLKAETSLISINDIQLERDEITAHWSLDTVKPL